MKIVITTLSNEKEARLLAAKAVEEKLAACVQILPQITSIYFWEGKIQKEAECLLIFKTLSAKCGDLKKFIAGNHPYEVPEIAEFSADDVSKNYSQWLKDYLLPKK